MIHLSNEQLYLIQGCMNNFFKEGAPDQNLRVFQIYHALLKTAKRVKGLAIF